MQNNVEDMKTTASQTADNVARSASDMADNVSTKLKSVGVDTDVMANAAKNQATELQRLIGDELQARPMRSLAIAAAFGVIVGWMSVR
jgi:ElaB/YqjD/DUF883 family membrane-anchored ribosome-binding protein